MRDHHWFDGYPLLATPRPPRERGEDAAGSASAGPAAEGGYRVTAPLPYATLPYATLPYATRLNAALRGILAGPPSDVMTTRE